MPNLWKDAMPNPTHSCLITNGNMRKKSILKPPALLTALLLAFLTDGQSVKWVQEGWKYYFVPPPTRKESL